nr:hypothetical protein [Tanacetum cinerariifolium]
MCHLVIGATWFASCHRSHRWTTGRRWRSMKANDGGQRWCNDSAPSLTTAGPSPDHQSTVVDRQSMNGSGYHVQEWTTGQPPLTTVKPLPDHQSTSGGLPVNERVWVPRGFQVAEE